MALTREILVANEGLSALTEEQINAITTLSQNDENSVIAQKTGEIYGGLDNDILSVTGVQKNSSEKTYDYAKRVLNDYKSKLQGSDDLQKQIANLQSEKSRLEEIIKNGKVDEETKRELNQAKLDLSSVKNQYNEIKEKYEKSESEFQNRIYDMRINSELNSAKSQMNFKSDLNKEAIDSLVESAYSKIKGMKPVLEKGEDGQEHFLFRDEKGATLNNPENQLKPYTIGEFLKKELKGFGILDEGRKQAGAGTHQTSGNKNEFFVDLSGAKTRVEANAIIDKELIAKGYAVGSSKYTEAMTKIWKDNNVMSLPER